VTVAVNVRLTLSPVAVVPALAVTLRLKTLYASAPSVTGVAAQATSTVKPLRPVTDRPKLVLAQLPPTTAWRTAHSIPLWAAS
jgi:hypothetical protein